MAILCCFLVLLVVSAVQVTCQNRDNCPFDTSLAADDEWNYIVFNQSLPAASRQSRGMHCIWQIKSNAVLYMVRLKFPHFHLKNSTAMHTGDCVAIYNSDEDSLTKDHMLAEVCDRLPPPVYNSTGRYLTVVFRQGQRSGPRWFSMNYTQVLEEDDDLTWIESLVESASTFGVAVVVAIVLYCVFKAFCKHRVRGRSTRECVGDCLSDMCNCLCTSLSHLCSKISRSCSKSSSSSQPRPEVEMRSRLSSVTPPPNEDEESAHEAPATRRGSIASLASLELFPPDYSSVTAQPSAPPMENGGGGGATRYGDDRNQHANNPALPPPSYDSLFQDEKKY